MQTDTLPEIVQIEQLLSEFPHAAHGQVLGHVGDSEKLFPIYKICVGSEDPQAPVLSLIGGVHGLERIGAQVVISLLSSVLKIQLWDQSLQELLKNIRLVFIPTVNPWGIYNRRRSNANGVDLMRNSPVIADNSGVPWMLGGQRYSSKLPWYQGETFQEECKLVLDALKTETQASRFAMSLDIHSGFGLQDQIWFPFAKTSTPFPDLAEVYRFKNFFETAHPYHFYKIEPQTYRTHGDLWDHLYSELRTSERYYLPLTLELGSWIWVKKNPLQLFSKEGLFHPLRPHRHRRILRRHWTLFDFMMRMANSHQTWSQLEPLEKAKAHAHGLELWYGKTK